MPQYTPPLEDIRFVLETVLELPGAWRAMPALAEVDADIMGQVLDEAGKFAAEVLAPLNPIGDRAGCVYADGKVATPAGFPKAYQAFVDAGWATLACSPDWGGQGLPFALHTAVEEMMVAANHAWHMYPGLLHGAQACVLAHGGAALQARYLPRLVSGEWLPTMCLTEPQAGSDLGRIRTRARALEDGGYAISGSKIFISGGEHDLTRNIVHLVLARHPGGPDGPKGLSLFLVPKLLPNGPDPAEGDDLPNAVHCDGIEHKLGLRGSATCSLRFEDARGWLLGEPCKGLNAMFVMMNAARLSVSLQGLGHGEAAYQHALRYAFERRQGRPAPGSASQDDPAALAAHPAVASTLAWQRCMTEGLRMLSYSTAHALDLAEHAPDEASRRQADEQLALLTPVVKAYCTRTGFEVADRALQVFGGHGYIEETGIAQELRDSRVSLLYEGTNEIQAIDLLARKTLADGGAAYGRLLDALAADGPEPQRAALHAALGKQRALLAHLAQANAEHPGYAYRAADDFLKLTALLCLARWWLRVLALPDSAAAPAGKADIARYFFDFVLPEADLLDLRIRRSLAPLPSPREP